MFDIMLARSALLLFFDKLPIVTLRNLGRRYGIANATTMPKPDLVAQVTEVVLGASAKFGAKRNSPPPSEFGLDDSIDVEIDRAIDRAYIPDIPMFTVASPAPYLERKVEGDYIWGYLEITQNGYGFLRSKNRHEKQTEKRLPDVFVSEGTIHTLGLRNGDFICCSAQMGSKPGSLALKELVSVNGRIGSNPTRPKFEELTAEYPKTRFQFSSTENDMALRLIDLFVPIGYGQRGLIIAPPKAGKTTLLKSIARSIAGVRDQKLIVLLIDERPEEVTDIAESVRGVDVVYSTFDRPASHHIRAARMVLCRAKRLVEAGRNVVILLDSLTKLTRAYNSIVESSGKTLTGGLDATAFTEPKRFFGAARNTKEGGSLTILATVLVDTGSRMDQVIYEEFKGAGNSDIVLSAELAERRIFPAIDIPRSGTRREELLFTKEELEAVSELRKRGIAENTAGLIDMLKRTENNAEFLKRLPEWLRVYKP